MTIVETRRDHTTHLGAYAELDAVTIGTLAVVAAMYLASYLYSRLREQLDPDEHWLSAGLGWTATVLLWWVVSAETWCYTGWQLGLGTMAQHFALSGAWILFAGVLLQAGILRGVASLRWVGVGLLAMTTVKVLPITL